MRTLWLGSIAMLGLALSSSAWGAEPAAADQRAAPPETASEGSSETPAPKPLPGPVAGPLPPNEARFEGDAAAVYDAPPPPPPPRAGRRSEWGVQFRIQAAPMSQDASPQAGMGGIGFSLRPRPSPNFAVDFGLDFIGGRDFNGDRRSESAFTVNPMLFINPRDKVQVYFLAGLGAGSARVESGNVRREYRYVGVDAGAGVEFRFWQRLAFSADVVGFVRDRTAADGGGPEYVEPSTGRFTDSSAGALVRLGGIYYW
jgi:hypothetical protein